MRKNATSSDSFAVGSIVRAKNGSKRCRAMVATVGANDGDGAPSRLCLLWEPYYPKKIGDKFWVLPRSIQKEEEGQEATVNVNAVENLFPFEADPGSETNLSIDEWKGRGDQLLRLGDASAAASFYEKALEESSSISIGGTVVVSVDGFPRIAEVDCCDDDDNTIDIALVHNGDERTIPLSQVLLGLLENDPESFQERILLNLARCTMQLADLDATNRPKYLKSAVLATTLVVAIAEFRQEEADESLPKNSQTAIVLRCKAYTSLSKWPRATADARKLVKSGREEGQKMLATIERKKKIQFSKDKKLAKDICRLVQSATAANDGRDEALVSSDEKPSGDGTVQENNSQVKEHSKPSTQSPSLSTLYVVFGSLVSTYFILALVMALVSMWTYGKSKSEDETS